jgi:hypothetical protein
VALTVGAAAIAVFLVLDFGVLPWMEGQSARQGGTEEMEIKLQRYQRLAARGGVEAQRVAAQQRLADLESGLLESRSVSLANAEWQQSLRELADSLGIEVGRSEFLRLQELGPEYALVTGRVQFRCHPEQLVNFLVALASAPRLLSVTRLRVFALPGNAEGQLNVEMTLGAAMRAVPAAESPTPRQE